MSSNYGFIKHYDALEYLKRFGKRRKFRSLASLEILKGNIIRGHTESELKVLRLLLNTAIEKKKYHGPATTIITIFATSVTTFLIYYFVFSTNFMMNMINTYINKNFDFHSDKINTQEELDEALQEILNSSEQVIPSLINMASQIFVIILVVLIITWLICWEFFIKDYRHLQFYKNLIDECIAEKEKEEKNLSNIGEQLM